MRRLALLTLTLVGCVTTPKPPAIVDPPDGAIATAGATRVPLIVSGQNALLVDVVIRGQRVRLLLDTGAQSTVLDLGVARKLGITVRPTQSYSIGVGAGRVAGYSGEPTPFTIGDATVVVSPRLQDFTNITWAGLSRGGEPVVGLLGFDVLRAGHAVLDMDRGELWLRGEP